MLWRYAPTGPDALNKPSLALPLPNGDVIANDDEDHHVIVIDPRHRYSVATAQGHPNPRIASRSSRQGVAECGSCIHGGGDSPRHRARCGARSRRLVVAARSWTQRRSGTACVVRTPSRGSPNMVNHHRSASNIDVDEEDLCK